MQKAVGAALFIPIFLLTGCARRGYHTPVAPGAAPETPAAFSAGELRTFAWPLDGEIVVPYGALEEQLPSKGIVIQAREGRDVVASRGGRVGFVDPALPGYGSTVVLEHPGGYTTVYARNEEVLVRPGETVRRGQLIARAARLYFEIRHDGRPSDPAGLLDPGHLFRVHA